MIKKIHNIQQKIGALSKDKENPFFKSKYTDINQILDQLLPLLGEEGLTVLQPLTTTADGKPAIRTIVLSSDENDESFAWETPLPENPDPQKMGSAITYYRRYALVSLFGLRQEDDDGNTASKSARGTKAEQTIEDEDFSL